MSYCSPDRQLTYLDTPSFISTALHCLSVIAIPTHLFGAYCVIFRTPPRMKSVKWSLLNLHFWSCLADIGLSLLTTPFILIPIFGGYPLGVLALIGVSPVYQVFFITAIGAVMGVAITGIFENRYHVLTTKIHWWRQARIPWAVVNYLIALTYFLPVYYELPNQVHTNDYLFMKLPCIRNSSQSIEFFLLNENPDLYIRLGGFEICFLLLQMVVFCQLINWNFRQQNCKLSAKTVAMQRKLMRALILQLAIPMFIVVFPLAYCISATIRGYHNQALNNLSFIIISSHGFLSTIAMIFMHYPYRQVVLRLFRKPKNDTSFALHPVASRHLTVLNIWRKSKFP